MTDHTPEPSILIHVVPEKLSDGSVAYNVELPATTLHAVDLDAAQVLAEAIANEINEHTVDAADVVEHLSERTEP